MKNITMKNIQALTVLAIASTGCTGQLPMSFRFNQQEELFNAQQEVNTKVDLLWVVDNSASMDNNQDKLRRGFSAFAAKYMKPTWDIRVAVIPTDLYIANSSFSNYLNTVVSGSVNWQSTQINSRLGSFVNPSWNTSLVNLTNARFTNGFKYKEMMPSWGALGFQPGITYARLLPGLHDGPIVGLCTEATPTSLFLAGSTHCNIRDNQLANTGVSHCLNPNTAAGETAVTQCVNTIENDTVRSGKAIISTMPPTGVAADAAWQTELVNTFMVNVTTGTAGNGSERGLGSVLELLAQNETSDTPFFRPGSIRGIVFVSDEEDQTMDIPASPPAGFNPLSYYRCDQASLLSKNPTKNITGNFGYCCSDPTKNCTYGAEGTSCDAKTVDGFTYTIGLCPRTDKLVAVSDVKTKLDNFFMALDGVGAYQPNYFVVSIVALTGQAIQTLQAERDATESAISGMFLQHSVDRADRYIQLGTLVGNGSTAMNIADADYSPILDAIGKVLVQKKSSFTLIRPPTGAEDMIFKVIHADGSITVIPSEKFVINGNTLTITDIDTILSLSATDKIAINYQPKTAG